MEDTHIQSEPPKLELPKVLVTARPEAPPEGSVIYTPSGSPDMEVKVSRWWVQVLVRASRSYLQNVLGYLLGAGLGLNVAHAAEIALAAADIRPDPDVIVFGRLFLTAMGAAVGPTVVCIIQNALELLAEADTKAPKWRA